MRFFANQSTFISRMRKSARSSAIFAASLLATIPTTVAPLSGCSSRRPTYLPSAIASTSLDDGGVEHAYDTDGDGESDYFEQINARGRVVRLRFDDDNGSVINLSPSAAKKALTAADHGRPHLLIILDSIPFAMVADAHNRGSFPYFYPPAKVISPFPVMTDLALNEFFGLSPAVAVETDYYDGEHSVDGWGPYAAEANSKWLRCVNYHRPFNQHGDAYLNPRAGFHRELYDVEQMIESRQGQPTVAYMVSTSALGFLQGRSGHQWGLTHLDRFCRALFHRYRGQIEITLMSDHGHQFVRAKRAPIESDLRRLGYRVTDRLRTQGDVVVPRYGLVSAASLHTSEPRRVAADLSRKTYVEFAAFRQPGGGLCVVVRDKRAIIELRGDRFRYTVESGDPLRLAPVIAKLTAAGKFDADGFASDEDWFAATTEHLYPDPLYRLHRAVYGLVEHVPDVLVSLRSDWFFGSPFMALVVAPQAIHGSLSAESSAGFAMTTVEPLPRAVRMIDLATALHQAGWPVINPGDSAEPMSADREMVDRSGTGQTESVVR